MSADPQPLPDPFAAAEKLNEAARQLSDLLNGGVHTLIGEGWTEEQARQIVLTAYTTGTRDTQ